MGKVMPAEELAGTKASKGPHPSCWAASSSSETGPPWDFPGLRPSSPALFPA